MLVHCNVNEWNNKTTEITGYSKEKDLNKSIVPKFCKVILEVLYNAFNGKDSNYELEFLTKSGEIRTLLVKATTRQDPEGNIIKQYEFSNSNGMLDRCSNTDYSKDDDDDDGVTLVPSIGVCEGMSLNHTLGVYDCTLGTLEGYEFSNSVGVLVC